MIKARTKLTEKCYIETALDRLGIKHRSMSQKILLENGECWLSQQRDGTWRIEGDPYYASDDMRYKYYGNTQQMVADLQTNYNIAMTTDKMSSLGYSCVDNEEGMVNTEEGEIQMVFEGL
jgi:hypothetical protein